MNGFSQEAETFTQEFLLASTGDDNLQWLFGLYYLQDNPIWDPCCGNDFPLFGFFQSYDADNETSAYAVFGDLSYSLTEKLRLNAGLRYSYETKDFACMVNTPELVYCCTLGSLCRDTV